MKKYGPGATPAAGTSREPEWTTGQGIGFLVSFSGWLVALFGLIGVIASSNAEADGAVVAIFGSWIALGVIAAIPGTVVFNNRTAPASRRAPGVDGQARDARLPCPMPVRTR